MECWSLVPSKEIKCSEKMHKMYITSYKKIGINKKWNTYDPIKDYYPCAWLLRKGGKCIGSIMYWQTEYGNKIGIVVSDTPKIAKLFVIPKLVDLITSKGCYYVELSDALEYYVKYKYKVDNIQDKTLLLKLVWGLKEKDIFGENDDRRNTYKLNKYQSPRGSYLREIQGIGVHRKALYGLPCFISKLKL